MCISDISSELSRCVTCVNVIEHVMIMIWEGEDVVHVFVYRMALALLAFSFLLY